MKVDEDTIIKSLTSDGFLKRYVQYMGSQTEAPILFHLATSLSILGAAMGDSIRSPFYGGDVYPNTYSVIVAPTGFYYKSSAIGKGVEFLTRAVPDRLAPQQFSPEALVETFANQPAGVIVHHEFTGLLKELGGGKRYMAGAMRFLTSAFDGRPYKRKTKESEYLIERCAPSILSATTLDWLTDTARKQDLRGGFLARVLWWTSTTLNDPLEAIPDPDPATEEKIVNFLRDVSQKEGRTDLKAAMPLFSAWQKDFRRRVNAGNTDPELYGVYSRAPPYVVKIATILEVADAQQQDGGFTVSQDNLMKAILLVEMLLAGAEEIVAGFADTRQERYWNKLLALIKRKGKATQSEICKHMKNVRARELEALLDQMTTAGEIHSVQEATRGRPRTVWKVGPKRGQ